MALGERERAFLEANRAAAMVTVGRDGFPKPARVAVALVDGRLWSSGTATRVRTARLRRDPRCTLIVLEPSYAWLALETTVTILDGDDAPELNLRLFRQVQGKPSGPLTWFGQELDEAAFEERMRAEQRLVYEFEVHRSYGLF